MNTINRFLILSLLISSVFNFFGCQTEANDETDTDSKHKVVIVEPGNEGFLFKPNSIGIDTTVAFNEGPHKIPLDEEMIQYSIRQQILMVESTIEFNSDTTLCISATVHHSITRGKASSVHFTYGPNYEYYIKDEFIKVCESILKEMRWTEILSGKGEKLENKIYRKFADYMSTSGISINYFELEKIEILE